jgi:mRNA interferase MazF
VGHTLFFGVVVCAAITSNLQIAAAPGNVRMSARSSGLPKPSVVNVSQIATMDKTFLRDRIKSLDAQTMRQVDEGLRLVLNL